METKKTGEIFKLCLDEMDTWWLKKLWERKWHKKWVALDDVKKDIKWLKEELHLASIDFSKNADYICKEFEKLIDLAFKDINSKKRGRTN